MRSPAPTRYAPCSRKSGGDVVRRDAAEGVRSGEGGSEFELSAFNVHLPKLEGRSRAAARPAGPAAPGDGGKPGLVARRVLRRRWESSPG